VNHSLLAVGVAAVLVLGVVSVVARAQTENGIPRTPWGEPDLSGVWKLVAPVGARPGQDTMNLTQLEQLYTAEGRARMKELSAKDDPALNCMPSAFPRAVTLGSAIQIVQTPGLTFIFTEAFPLYRIVPTDGKRRLSAAFLIPYYMGSSAGHWEDDTLVVDVISLNGKSWLAGYQDRPTPTSTGRWPTSENMHVTERWRRVDADTLEFQARVEDSQMLSAPWDTPKIMLKRQAADRIEEALCLERDGASTYLERMR